MNITEKKEIVQQLTAELKKAQAVIFANYQGLSAEKMRELRRLLKKAGASFIVVKNTLVKRALEASGWAKIAGTTLNLEGPIGITLCQDEPPTVLKTLLEFVKTNTLPQLKLGLYQNLVLGAEKLKELANLPSREILLSQLLGTMKTPVRRVVQTLQSPSQKMVYALKGLAFSRPGFHEEEVKS